MRLRWLLCCSLVLAASLAACSNEGRIETVAPYAFMDYGNSIEVKGGWNYSETKYESTNIYCDKAAGICADYTARLYDNHLNIAPMLWKIQFWGNDAVVAVSAIPGMYSEHLLHIDRRSKRVRILKRANPGVPIDLSKLDDLVVTEVLQNTFYQR